MYGWVVSIICLTISVALGCQSNSDVQVVPINVPFELIQETSIQEGHTMISVRVSVETDFDVWIVVMHNGVEIGTCIEDCDDWIIISEQFMTGDHIRADLRVGEIYRDTYCIILE